MIWYRYQGINSKGEHVAGRIHAADHDEVASLLQEQGVRIERIEEDEGVAEMVYAAPERSQANRRSNLSSRDFELISDHLSDLTRAKLPLSKGLEAVSHEIENARVRTAVQNMAVELEAGNDLETVLSDSKAPRELCALVHAGTQSGRMTEILADYVAHTRQLSEMKNQLLMALSYPLILLGFATLVLLSILLWIVPSFESIYQDFGIELPGITLQLIQVSYFLRTQWWWYLPAALFSVMGCLWFFRTEVGQAWGQRLIYHLPLVGSLLSGITVSRFSHLLALLVDNGTPFHDAMKLSGESSSNFQIRAACRQFAESESTGEAQVAPLESLNIFPATFLRTLANHTGTSSRKEPKYSVEILNALSDMLNSQAKVRITFFATVVEPLIIIFCGSLMGLLFIAMLAPLIKLLGMLS